MSDSFLPKFQETHNFLAEYMLPDLSQLESDLSTADSDIAEDAPKALNGIV